VSSRHSEHLAQLEVQRYALREGTPAEAPSEQVEARPVAPGRPAVEVPLMAWNTLRQTVAGCRLCGLEKTRTQTVFGVGDPNADWLFIGEAPGADEDAQGEPFVGRAGQLLNSMIKAIGLERSQVYIANILKCLRYNALVQLEDGSWERIGRLVRSRFSGRVMSVDGAGLLVPRRVTGWYETPVGGRRVFRLCYRSVKNAGAARVGVQLTGDHPVLTERGYVPVQELTASDRVATGQGLSALAFDVVCGTLLGDAHIPFVTSLLAFSHSARQRDYALFKAGLLAELKPRHSDFLVAAVAGGERKHATVQVYTAANRALRILRREFYSDQNRKCVPTWLANKLNERMLAIWFMDDGYTRLRPNRQPLSELATCAFSDSDLAVLAKGLRGLGLHAIARRGRLEFNVFNSRLLSERIAPYVPPSMRYKLHPDIEQRVPFEPERLTPGAAEVLFDDVEVTEITHVPRSDKTFFCIDVEETHNFVSAGGVVHNCRPPNNRDPRPEEAAHCTPYLQRQIELIAPRIILVVGRIAAQTLLQTDTPIGRMRGRLYHFGPRAIPVVVTYHPAYLLRSPGEKRKAWTDLLFAQDVLARGHG
jgi:uracil-DNA glycosylase